MEQEDEKEFVALAKEIIQKCNLSTRVDRLTDCRDQFFVLLYKGLIGDNLKGLISYPVIHNEHIHNCQSVIDSLANDVLNVDLTHISAKGIVDGDTLSIKNLLEIFSGLLEYFLECIDENQSDSEDGLDDSNVITSQHDVISSLLKEEFGTSHRDESRQEKSTESMAKPTSATSRPATASLYNRTNQRPSRVPAEPSLRFSSYSGLLSGHEADTSEVSDSTNELIKLGESSSSGNSSIKRPVPVNLSHQKEPAKSTWKQSVSDADNHQELTQYTISSDEGDSSSLQNNKNQSSDHFSSSFVSSTSSWRQQISPLDADDNGVKLDTIGLRPKVDNVGEPGKDGNEDGSSSGRSTPVLHHHYHHHYHHPTDPRVSRAGNVSSSRHDNFNDYRNIPGNIKTSAVASSTHPNKAILPGAGAGGISKVPDYIPGQLARGDLPGTFDYTSRGTGHPGIGTSRYTRDTGNLLGQGISNLPLTDYSRLGLTGQTVASSLPTNSLPAYKTTAGSVLPGQGYGSQRIPTTEHSRPSLVGQYVSRSDPGYSRSITGTTSSTSTRALLEQSQAVPGTSGLQTTGPSIYTTTSTTLPRHTSIHGTTSILDPSRLRTSAHDGRHCVSTSIPVSYATTQPGLTSSSQLRGTTAATATGTCSLRDQYLSRVTPLTTTTSLPSSSGLLTVSSGGYSDVFTDTNKTNQYIPTNKSMDSRKARDPQELQRILPSQTNMVSTARKDDDQPPGLLKEDALAENTRHNHHDDDDYSDDDARYSDSAIDYNRGGDQVDSENEFSEDSILRRIHDRWKNLKTSKSTKPAARRGVTFNEDIQTIPITSRMDRLRRLLEDDAQEQRQQTASIRDVYAEQLQDIQKQQQQERKEMTKKKVQKTPLVSKKKTKKPVPSKQRGRLEAVYRPQGRPGRPVKRHAVKTRKRSASASPVARRKRKTSIADFHETLLPSLFEEFPFLHVSPQTTHAMWQKQARQISLLSKSETTALKTKSQRRVEEAEKRQERLLKILHKELEHNQRMRGERERQDHQRTITAKVNEKRQVAARARRYYDEYQLRMRAKMLKRRTREEQILKKLFDDGLEIQKQRVRELRKYAKDKNEAIEQKQSNEIESLENYYKDQFSILAEDMTRERHELKVRQNAQEKVMRQMRHELRKKMEKEIEDLQETLTRDEDSAYFRQLEADRLRREFQLAMYKSDL